MRRTANNFLDKYYKCTLFWNWKEINALGKSMPSALKYLSLETIFIHYKFYFQWIFWSCFSFSSSFSVENVAKNKIILLDLVRSWVFFFSLFFFFWGDCWCCFYCWQATKRCYISKLMTSIPVDLFLEYIYI